MEYAQESDESAIVLTGIFHPSSLKSMLGYTSVSLNGYVA